MAPRPSCESCGEFEHENQRDYWYPVSSIVMSVKQLNQLKSRYTSPIPDDFNPDITLDAILAPGDDTDRWSTDDAAEVEGYVLDAKPGGVETCNCRARALQYRDTNIEIVKSLNDSGPTKRVIVEVTPRVRAIAAGNGLNWSTPTLMQNLAGHHVRIRGWMLFDLEHLG